MAYYDRQWYHQPPPPTGARGPSPFGRISGWSVWVWLIVINVAVFVIDQIIGRATGQMPLLAFGYFSADTAILGGQIWRFITFQFLHDPMVLSHLVFNMLFLFFFGRLIETYLGSRRFLAFYLLCGAAGPVAYIFFWLTGFLVTGPGVPLIGASAGVFGILIAAALVAPNARVLLFFIIPMRLRTMAWFAVAVAALTVLLQGDQPGANAGGEAAHLGGAGLGFLLIRRPDLLNWADRWFGKRPKLAGFGGGKGVLGGLREAGRKRRSDHQRQQAEQVDRILEKVHREGLGSLSDKEKRLLRKATEHHRR